MGIIYHKIKKGTAHRSNNKQITEIKMKKKHLRYNHDNGTENFRICFLTRASFFKRLPNCFLKFLRSIMIFARQLKCSFSELPLWHLLDVATIRSFLRIDSHWKSILVSGQLRNGKWEPFYASKVGTKLSLSVWTCGKLIKCCLDNREIWFSYSLLKEMNHSPPNDEWQKAW